MSGSKAALKGIGVAIQAKKFDDAIQQARGLIKSDPKSYQGHIFLGFALTKRDKFEEAEKAYDAATKLKASDPQAWQGLIQLYEQQAGDKLGPYRDAVLELAKIYQTLDEKYKCQDVVDKFLGYAKSHGTPIQQKSCLEIILPTSEIYDYLEGRIAHPSTTYQAIAQITEFDETERMNREIGERRTRIGAKITEVTNDVKREIFRNSSLEALYSEIINWSSDDEIRRQYEEKLLQRSYQALIVLPNHDETKARKRAQVSKLARDMVIIKHPYKLAWEIAIEWIDPEQLKELDANTLRDYCSFFPTSGLAKVLGGFMSSGLSPFPPPPPPTQSTKLGDISDESEDDDEGGGVALNGSVPEEDRLGLMIEGLSDAPRSILAIRIMGEYYQHLEEYETLVELMRNAKHVCADETRKTGVAFEHTNEFVTSLLATGLVFYQSPRNHLEAKSLFEDVLLRNPLYTSALVGIGLIYEEEEDYSEAIDALVRALKRDPDNVRIKVEAAWAKALGGSYVEGKDELSACLSRIHNKDPRSRDLLAQTQYRIGLCLWEIDPSKAGRKDRNGAYSHFLAALKVNMNFAPAYTSLGIFYADYSKDKKRARKCFQKAFELSAGEVLSAERLAHIFARQGDWELVEAVAQRVVDSGKAKQIAGSKKKGIKWPFAALGVAELNKQEFSKSIVSFQCALRIAPDDYHSWVGLGESYHNSGRYVAATKAFQHAEHFEKQVEQGDTWFAKYMLSNVKRELGDYDDAINGYQSVLKERPIEFGVSIALIQTLVEGAWDGIAKGRFGHAILRASETIETALDITQTRSDVFNLWKAIGDACSIFSKVQSKVSELPRDKISALLSLGIKQDAFEVLSEVDGVGVDLIFSGEIFPEDEQEGVDLMRCLHAAILFHKYAVFVSATDVHAQAVAYYNLGWTEYRAHVCLYDKLKKKTTRYLKAAVRCFKQAIELEAGNPEFWNALGVATSQVNAKVAQHSFVRSLFLNERAAQVWTNLGALYLLHNDYDLANQAFIRGQSADPDYAHAWVGQGLIALTVGDKKEANQLFTHALEISDSPSIILETQYAQTTFDRILPLSSKSSVTDLIQPSFALNQLRSMEPTDQVHRHLSAMFLERMRNTQEAVEIISGICAKVEADYEITESASSLSQFALAKTDLARVQLAEHQYTEAIESGETALQLSAEDAGNKLSLESRQQCRLSAHLTIGLAQYYQQNHAAAAEYFQLALDESKGNQDVVCLLAQVLWAKGDEASRSKAQDVLFESVESHPDHVQSVVLLGAISLLADDEESLEAVTAELYTLRTNYRTTAHEQTDMGEILRAAAALSEDNAEQRITWEAQTDVLLRPHQPHGWNRLGASSENDAVRAFAGEMALKTAQKSVAPRGQLEADGLSLAFAGTGKMSDLQRGIMVAPWNMGAWNAFDGAVVG